MSSFSTFTPLKDGSIAVVHDTPEAIDKFVLASLKGRITLEMKGMRVSKGPSALKICKQRFPGVKNYEQALAKINETLMGA